MPGRAIETYILMPERVKQGVTGRHIVLDSNLCEKYNSQNLNFHKGVKNEKDVSAFKNKEKKNSWLQKKNEHEKRKADFKKQKEKGKKKGLCLTVKP
jgi:hypothetical protein